MTAPHLYLTHEDAYAGLLSADRAGDFKAALTLSNLLIRGFQTGKGVRTFPADRIPVVVEMERKARRQYAEAHAVHAKGPTDGI